MENVTADIPNTDIKQEDYVPCNVCLGATHFTRELRDNKIMPTCYGFEYQLMMKSVAYEKLVLKQNNKNEIQASDFDKYRGYGISIYTPELLFEYKKLPYVQGMATIYYKTQQNNKKPSIQLTNENGKKNIDTSLNGLTERYIDMSRRILIQMQKTAANMLRITMRAHNEVMRKMNEKDNDNEKGRRQ